MNLHEQVQALTEKPTESTIQAAKKLVRDNIANMTADEYSDYLMLFDRLKHEE